MAKDLDLKVRISAELGEIKSALAGLKGELNNVSKQANKAGGDAGKGFDKLDGSLRGIKSSVLGLVGAFAAAFSVKQIVDMADQAKLLEGRLRLATKTQEEFNIAQAGLIDIANSTRNELGQVVELYAKLSLATKEAGVSQGELLRVTETIGKAVQLSGASAEAAQASIIQLSQGLASGALRGDELNSVMEQTPRLAQAIAAGMGIGIGKLREMGQEGAITSDIVLQALQKQAQTIDAEFQKLPPTIGASITQIKNSMMELVGDMDRVSGASGGVANGLQDIAQWIREADFGPFVEAMVSAGETFDQFGQDIEQILDSLQAQFPEVLGEGGSFGEVMDFMAFAFGNLPAIARAAIQRVVVETVSFFQVLYAETAAFINKAGALVTSTTVAEVENELLARQDEILKAREDSIKAIDDEMNASIAAGQEASSRLRQEREERKKLAEESKRLAAESINNQRAAGGGKKAVGGSADGLALSKSDAEESIRELERVFDAGKIGLDGYYNEKKRLSAELANIEIQEAQRKVSEADTEKEKSKALTDLELAKRKAAANQAAIGDEERKAREKRSEETIADNEKLQIELAKIEGRGADARTLEVEAKYRDMLKRMQETGNTEGAALVEKLLSKERVKAQFDSVQEQFDKLLNDLQAKEESLSNRVRIGDITQGEADTQLDTLRADTQAQGAGLLEQQTMIAAGDPALTAQIDANTQALDRQKASATGLAAAHIELSASLQNMEDSFASSIANDAVNGLSTMFVDLINGTKSAKDAIADFANSMVQSMLKMAAQWMATWLILQIIPEPYRSAVVGISGMAGGTGAGVKHTGGIMGQGGTIRQVNPAMFAAAPRYHSGGIAGLKAGEMPAILQKGEEVLTRNDPRHAANGGKGGGDGKNTRVINVIDPNMVSDYMSSSQGEEVFLNIIQRNSGSIKQALA